MGETLTNQKGLLYKIDNTISLHSALNIFKVRQYALPLATINYKLLMPLSE